LTVKGETPRFIKNKKKEEWGTRGGV